MRKGYKLKADDFPHTVSSLTMRIIYSRVTMLNLLFTFLRLNKKRVVLKKSHNAITMIFRSTK